MILIFNMYIFKRGVDSGVSASSLTPHMKGFMYGMSILSLPFFMFLPSVYIYEIDFFFKLNVN